MVTEEVSQTFPNSVKIKSGEVSRDKLYFLKLNTQFLIVYWLWENPLLFLRICNQEK